MSLVKCCFVPTSRSLDKETKNEFLLHPSKPCNRMPNIKHFIRKQRGTNEKRNESFCLLKQFWLAWAPRERGKDASKGFRPGSGATSRRVSGHFRQCQVELRDGILIQVEPFSNWIILMPLEERSRMVSNQVGQHCAELRVWEARLMSKFSPAGVFLGWSWFFRE
jgi:hypothetical protein